MRRVSKNELNTVSGGWTWGSGASLGGGGATLGGGGSLGYNPRAGGLSGSVL